MTQLNAQSSRADLRMLAGFALVPPTAVLITLGTYQLMWHAGALPFGAPIHSLDSAGSLGVGVAILAVLMTVFGAVPGVIWLNGRRSLSLGRLLILGAGLGSVPFALIVLGVVTVHAMSGTLSTDIGRYWHGTSGAAVRLTMGLITGMGSAAIFWFVGVRSTAPPFDRH
jgi:hypothetical protein